MIGEQLQKNEIMTYWHNAHNRCYGKNKKNCYKDCTMCEEWLNDKDSFISWVNENYYTVEGETMCLDKDILVKGNKVYSPDTCIFVPSRINDMLGGISKKNKKNSDLPIGVLQVGNRYKANIKGYRNSHETIEEAFKDYKKHRESYIISVADEYIDKIPYKLYEALCNYTIDITD